MAKYDHKLLEEELKNKVAADWFAAFDTTRIIGKVDFCVAVRATGFLGAFDAEKIAFLPYEAVMEVFAQNDFNWNVATSADAGYNERLAALKAAMKRLSARIEPKVYEYGFLKK